MLNQAIRQRRLTMVDVGNDGEVSNMFMGDDGHAIQMPLKLNYLQQALSNFLLS